MICLMQRGSHSALVPALILKTIRDCADVSLAELMRTFGIDTMTSSPGEMARQRRLLECLWRLETAGLLAHVPADLPVLDMFRLFDVAHSTWSVTPRVAELQFALEISLSDLVEVRTRPLATEVEKLATVRTGLHQCVRLGPVYRQDLFRSIEEMEVSLDHGCYIAVMALAGKVLEICLKQLCDDLSIRFGDDWMLGTLLGKLDEAGPYLDPGLKNVANLIKLSRIPAVHAKSNIPIPSEDQAVMVVRATIDVIKRTLLQV